MLSLLWHLNQPEYVHVLLNPLPLYAMALGAGILTIALVRRSPGAIAAGLAVLVLAALATVAAVHYGEKGYDRVYAMSNTLGQEWLDVHRARAEHAAPFFYVTGAFALAALLLPQRKRWTVLLTGLTLAGAWFCVVAAGWISFAGGQIRHREFRNAPPSAQELKAATAEAEHS